MSLEISNLFSVKGKICLVTGGSRGIGEWIAKAFVINGAKVYISSRKGSVCDKIAAELTEIGRAAGRGGSCHSIPGDLSNLKEIKRVAQELINRETRLDVLVNNAGFAWGEPFETFSEKGWDRVMDLNLKGVFFLTQALAPLLKESGRLGRAANAKWPVPSKVINIASIDGVYLTGNDTFSYPSSKSGLIQLTRVLARHLAPFNIVVNGINPGAFATDMNKMARDSGDIVQQMVPVGLIGREEDMAAAALYLASTAGDYVVGSHITVDGGVAFATTSGAPIPAHL